MNEAKIIAGLLGIVIFLGALFFGFRAVYDAGKESQASADATAMAQFKASIQATTDAAIAQVTKDKETALANNEGVTNDLQTQLDSMRNLSSTLSQRLRDAESRASSLSGALSKTSDQLAATTGSTTSILGQINGAIADALNECGAVRADYKALIAEVKPQI